MTKWKYPFSKGMLASLISKLRLEKGDIIVVKDYDTLRALGEMRLKDVDFPVPLVFAPGGIQKLGKQDLLNLLEDLEKKDKSVLETASISGPL